MIKFLRLPFIYDFTTYYTLYWTIALVTSTDSLLSVSRFRFACAISLPTPAFIFFKVFSPFPPAHLAMCTYSNCTTHTFHSHTWLSPACKSLRAYNAQERHSAMHCQYTGGNDSNLTVGVTWTLGCLEGERIA